MCFSGAAAVTIATVMTPQSMTAAGRVTSPTAISAPQINSVLATNGAWISGAGMPSERKYWINPVSLPSLPSPEPKNSSPTATRTSSRATHSMPSSRA